jgi:hypothetical protein
MPDDNKRIFLGNFQSMFDALNAGKKHFLKSNSCRFCSKDHDSDVHSRTFFNNAVPLTLANLDRLTTSLENALQCCIN